MPGSAARERAARPSLSTRYPAASAAGRGKPPRCASPRPRQKGRPEDARGRVRAPRALPATSRPRGRAPLRSRGPTARRTTRRRGERRRPPSSSVEATTPKVESPLNSIASEKPTNNLHYRTQSELPRAARRRVRAEKKPSTPLRDAKRVRLDRRRSPQIAPRAGFISPPRSSRRDAFPEGFAGVAAGLRRAIPIGTPRRPRRGISPRRVVPFRARREEATARDASSREPLRAVARCPPTLTRPLPARRPRGAPRGLSPPRRTASTSRRPQPRARW